MEHCIPPTIIDLWRIGEPGGRTWEGEELRTGCWVQQKEGLGGAKRWEGLWGGGMVSGKMARFQAVRGWGSTTTRWRDWDRENFLSPSWTPKITKAIPSTFFPYRNLRGKKTSGTEDLSDCGWRPVPHAPPRPSPGRDGNFQALWVIDVIKWLLKVHQDLETGQHWGGVWRWQRWRWQGCQVSTGTAALSLSQACPVRQDLPYSFTSNCAVKVCCGACS